MFTVTQRGIKDIKVIKPTFPYASIPEFKKVLLADEMFGKKAIHSDEELPIFAEADPIDGVEFVHWMHEAAAANAVLSGILTDFNDIGAQIGSASGDGYIPGVRTPNIRFRSVRGSSNPQVICQGKSFSVPTARNGIAQIITPDVIGYATVLWPGSYQWAAAILEWLKLALGRFTGKNIRFATFGGHPTMMAFKMSSRAPIKPPVANIVFTTVSDRETVYTIEGRDLSDFTKVSFTDEITIPSGEVETIYLIAAFPYVENFLLTLKPKVPLNGAVTSMDMYP
jgi:hypothetical protein